MASTRSKSEFYLVGCTIESFVGSKLPSIGDVLRVYLHKLKHTKTKQEAAADTIDNLTAFWEKASIPMRPKHHAIRKKEKSS